MFHYSCQSLCHPAFDSKNDFHKTLSGRNRVVLFCALSMTSFCQFVLPFPTEILCCISIQTFSPATNCWNGVRPRRLSPFRLRGHCWCSHTSPLANFQCSHRVVLAPFCTICSLHLIVVWLLQATWLPEWSLQLPSFLAIYVSRGRTGRSNTSIRTLCFYLAVTWSLPSTCHMQVDWHCLTLP